MIEKNVLLNSDVEISLRILILLDSEFGKKLLDIDEILYLDYLAIHISDFDSSLTSIHPSIPKKEQEMLVRRGSVQKAIFLLSSRNLISIKYTKSGIKYASNDFTHLFVNYFESSYAKRIKENIKILTQQSKLELLVIAKEMILNDVMNRKKELNHSLKEGEKDEWI